MPKPFTEHPGSGMHTHLSLFEGDAQRVLRGRRGVPALQDRPRVHRRPAASTRRRSPRSRTSGSTPTSASPAVERRPRTSAGATTTAPRWCASRCTSRRRAARPGSSTARIDSACNPYLAFALLLAAGLKGIEESYELPPEAEDDVWALTEDERRALGIEPLPRNLDEAIRSDGESELVAETLGEHVFDFFLRNKRAGVGGLPLAGHAVRARPHDADALKGTVSEGYERSNRNAYVSYGRRTDPSAVARCSPTARPADSTCLRSCGGRTMT